MKHGADKELLDGIAARIEESRAALCQSCAPTIRICVGKVDCVDGRTSTVTRYNWTIPKGSDRAELESIWPGPRTCMLWLPTPETPAR